MLYTQQGMTYVRDRLKGLSYITSEGWGMMKISKFDFARKWISLEPPFVAELTYSLVDAFVAFSLQIQCFCRKFLVLWVRRVL